MCFTAINVFTFITSEQKGLVDESQCRSCRPGFYCLETGLSAVSGPCLPGHEYAWRFSWFLMHCPSKICSFSNTSFDVCIPGFYCLEGSQTSTPVSRIYGDVCPAGHYCTEGSSVPTPCPAGSYENETGGKSKDDCKPCPTGKQEVILQKHLWVCTNSLVFIIWMSLPGWFQELSGQRQCNPCPSGFHCQSLVSSPIPCPVGYICPGESLYGQPLPCPRGTYNPSQGLTTTGILSYNKIKLY